MEFYELHVPFEADKLSIMHQHFSKYLKVLFLLLAMVGAAGCASVTRYSIESYQGPLLQDSYATTTEE